MRNVELKSRDPDPAHTLELALALGATDEGEIVQRDTYFGGSRARLKLREQTPGGDDLIAYRRPADDEARASQDPRVAGGGTHAGTNVENAAYPQSQCAEGPAIGAMVAAGETSITAIAVVAQNIDLCPPCGGCRQRLSEFAAADTPVYLGDDTTTT